jgi:hypothetical protein
MNDPFALKMLERLKALQELMNDPEQLSHTAFRELQNELRRHERILFICVKSVRRNRGVTVVKQL